MKVLYSPQVNENDTISYEFNGEIVTVTLNGEVDEFDFSGFTDGVLNFMEVETIFPFSPIVYADRVDGVLSLVLIKFITEDSPDEDKFPEWKEI